MSSTVKLKYQIDPIRRGNPPSYVENGGIPVVNQGCVWPSGLDGSKFKQHNPEEIGRIDAWLRENDVLVNSTGTGTLGRVCHLNFKPETDFFADGHVTILRDSKGVLKTRYLFYVLSIQQERITVECSEGATNQIELSRSLLGNLKFEWPSLKIQTKIVNYLDRKTADLDQLIGAKQRLLKLLGEKKRALIAHAVTRGLNPDVPLKDSGIPWLGKIPAHWQKTVIKRLFRFTKRQNCPDLEVLSVYREYGVIIKSSRNDNNNRTPEDLTKYQLVEPGDLVINKMKAWQGSMGISNYTGITSPDYVVYESNHDEVVEFLHYLFRAPFMPNVYKMFSNGIRLSQWRLEPEHFENLVFYLPPFEEQYAIVANIKEQLGKIDELHAVAEKTVALLHERRMALISAAVTGKLEEAYK